MNKNEKIVINPSLHYELRVKGVFVDVSNSKTQIKDEAHKVRTGLAEVFKVEFGKKSLVYTFEPRKPYKAEFNNQPRLHGSVA